MITPPRTQGHSLLIAPTEGCMEHLALASERVCLNVVRKKKKKKKRKKLQHYMRN